MYSLSDEIRDQAPAPLAIFDQEYVAPENQKLMSEYLALFKMLKGRELRHVTNEREKVRRRLLKAGYNDLCLALDERAYKLDTIIERFIDLKRRALALKVDIEAAPAIHTPYPKGFVLSRWRWRPSVPGTRAAPRAWKRISATPSVRSTKADELRQLVRQLRRTARDGRALQAQQRQTQARLDQLKPIYERYVDLNYALESHDQAAGAWRTEKTERRLLKREARYIESLLKDVFRNTAECHRAWTDSRGVEHIKIPRFEQIGIDSDSHWLRLATSKKTLFGYRSVLPYRVNIEALISERTLQNMSVAVRRQVEVRTDPSKTVIIFRVNRLDSPDGLPRLVTYRHMLRHYPQENHELLPFPGGVKSGRKNYWLYFGKQPHLLVAGFTKSGKSNFVNCIIATAVTMFSPAEVRICLIDNKGGIEFTHWSDVPHLYGSVVERVGDVFPRLEMIINIINHRLQLMKAVRAKDIETFNAEHADRKMPRLLVFVDEMATLMHHGPLTGDIHDALSTISAQGRASGVHLILCTQHPSKEIVPMHIKTNLAVRVTGRMPTGAASMVVLDTHQAKDIEAVPGRMIIMEGPDPEIVQTPFISNDDIRQAVSVAQRYPAGNDEHESLVVTGDALHLSFSERDVLQIVLEYLSGALKASKVWEMVKDEKKTTNREVQRLVKSLSNKESVKYEGVTFRPKKMPGNFFQLVAAEPVEEDTSEVAAVVVTEPAAD